MRRRLVALLTIFIVASYGLFLAKVIVNDASNRNAFEESGIIGDTPTATGTASSTPNPCVSPTASQTATAGTSPTPVGSSESNINRSGPPCPSPSPGNGTATATVSPTATTTPTATVTAGATSTIGITPKPIGTRTPGVTPTPKTSPTRTATPTPCPTDSGGSYDPPECAGSLSVQLLFRVPEQRGSDSNSNPYRIVYDQGRMFTISGIGDNPFVQQLWAQFFCGDPSAPNDSVTKPVDNKGVASVDLGRELASCRKEDVRAKIIGYTDVNDGLPIAGTKADPIHFGDYSYRDGRGKTFNYPGFDRSERGVNYFNTDGTVATEPVTAKIWDSNRSPQNRLKVVGVRPAVGGNFTITGADSDSWKFCYLPSVPEIDELTWGNFTCDPTNKNVAKDITNPKFYLFGASTGNQLPDTISMGEYVRTHNGDPTGSRDFRITAISKKERIKKGDNAKWLSFDEFVDNTGQDKNDLTPELIGFKRAVTDPNQRSGKGNRRDRDKDEVVLQVPGIKQGIRGHCGRAAVGMVGFWYYSGADNTAWSIPYSQRPAVPVGNGMDLRRLFINLPVPSADQRIWYQTNKSCSPPGALFSVLRAFPQTPATLGVIRTIELPASPTGWKAEVGNYIKKSIDNGDPVIFYGETRYRGGRWGRHMYPIIGYKTKPDGTLGFLVNNPSASGVAMKSTTMGGREVTIDFLYETRHPQGDRFIMIGDRANL